ncbi:unnamed protein product [Meganyctiphanes norvegica]|uniref:Uncharacterized protein n=1 Tax=Meganyctiphanes norvegica TaxID=48144 RepID=A0AAV2RCN4_MEGNR
MNCIKSTDFCLWKSLMGLDGSKSPLCRSYPPNARTVMAGLNSVQCLLMVVKGSIGPLAKSVKDITLCPRVLKSNGGSWCQESGERRLPCIIRGILSAVKMPSDTNATFLAGSSCTASGRPCTGPGHVRRSWITGFLNRRSTTLLLGSMSIEFLQNHLTL